MLKQKLSFETDTQDPLLEEWYWHTLYFMRRSQAKLAQQQILATFDGYCELSPHFDQYSVTFSTNYLFGAEHQQQLARLIDKPIETSFNEAGEDEEDLLDIFRWPGLELVETTAKARTHITHDRCTLCGTRKRASHSLWCLVCKRAHLKEPLTEQELDLCPLCDVPLGREHSRKARIVACLVLAAVPTLFLVAVLIVSILPGLLAGMLAGLALWWLEERRKHADRPTLL